MAFMSSEDVKDAIDANSPSGDGERIGTAHPFPAERSFRPEALSGLCAPPRLPHTLLRDLHL